jgi:membrane protein DedA with SNARE-associated domain
VEAFIHSLQSVDPVVVYLVMFGIAYMENLLPPLPSDVIIVFGGALVGFGRVGFAESLVASTLGSALGFVTMFKIGEWFGVRILEKGKISFIPLSAVKTVDGWFQQYGYWIIVANRFLAGTRAVVSFFAGMTHLHIVRTTALCALSALVWNFALILGGYSLGNNWQKIGFYLTTYSQVVTATVVVVALLLIARYFSKRKGRRTPSS